MNRVAVSGERFRKAVSGNYGSLLRLFSQQPWLAAREAEVIGLLTLCENESEAGLVLDLLHRFEFVGGSRLSGMLAGMADAIVAFGLPAASTQIVAITSDELADSAQFLLHFLRESIERKRYRPAFVNNMKNLAKTLRTHNHVVLIDEFVGGGTTMRNRINNVRTVFEEQKKLAGHGLSLELRVCVLAAMERSKPVMRSAGVEPAAQLWLKPGISGAYSKRRRIKATRDMLRLESHLDHEQRDGEAFPSFGYDRCESLYKCENANTPNSVFPLFWWPRIRGGQDRSTIVVRQMSPASRQTRPPDASYRRGATDGKKVKARTDSAEGATGPAGRG